MKTLDQQLSEYGSHREETSQPITAGELTEATTTRVPTGRLSVPTWLVAVAVAATVLLVGLATRLWISDRAGEVIDTPSTTAVDLETEAAPTVTWRTPAGFTKPWLNLYGHFSVVSNGSSFLGLFGPDPNKTNDVVLIRSVNGVDWVEVEPPALISGDSGLVVAGGVYLFSGVTHPVYTCGANNKPCPLWESADGLNWEQVDSVLDHQFDLIDVNWQVQGHERILTTKPVRSNGLDGFYRVVMEYPGRLVQYRTEYPKYDSGEPAFTEFAATVSTDGIDWSPVDPLPPFADALTDEYLRAGWQWMWRCEISMQGTQAMMLVSDDTGQHLWSSVDGLTWSQLPDPPQPSGPDARGHCITPIGDGWLITPGGHTLGDPRVGTAEDLYYSSDGMEWTSLGSENQPPPTAGRIEVVGNAIFIISPDTGETVATGIVEP